MREPDLVLWCDFCAPTENKPTLIRAALKEEPTHTLLTSPTVSRESRLDEKINGYLDFEATEVCPRLDICVVPV